MTPLNRKSPYLVIVMGVSGSGKTSIAKALAKEYGITFMEADDFHSLEAKKHMASGRPLTDEMRGPWITRMTDALSQGYKDNKSYVLSYSGLKAAHRQRFRELPFSQQTTFVMLDGEKDIIEKRMKGRRNHFMPAELLTSQFDAMERPDNEPDVLIIPVNGSLSDTLRRSKKQLANKIL